MTPLQFSDTENPGGLLETKQRARHFRIAAAAVLVCGFLCAGWVYWRGSKAVDLSNDPSMMGYDKKRQYQMEMYYGRQGLVLDQLIEALKQPKTQALLILAGSVLIAGGCFYVAHLLDVEARLPKEPADL